MITTNNLTKIYGEQKALDQLNLKVNQGEIYCLLGANGAGKTTTINLLLGFIKPTSGIALIDNMSVHQNSQETKKNWHIYLRI
jgi:ABC-2 type transport system ATP-binding protein